jgi:hydrogenase maturation protease
MKTLVAGLGNVLLGDDGFGVEVAHRLRAAPLPARVHVEDFGVRAIHLAYELLEPYDAVILVDAMSRGAAPGTLFLIEPGRESFEEAVVPDAHALHPAAVLRMARRLGARLAHVRLLACEPGQVDEGIGLSPEVTAAVAEAVRIVHQILHQIGRDLVAPRHPRQGD